MWRALAAILLAVTASAQTVTNQTTVRLTESGNDTILPPVAGAVAPPEPFGAPLHVGARSSRTIGLFNPQIAIPYDSKIRQLEAYWNGTPLPLIDPSGTGLAEEAHTYGSMIPFFKPLFSVAAIPSGSGTLEIRGFDAAHAQIASASLPNLFVAAPPAPVATATIAAMPHPRIYLTPARLAEINARPPWDIARMRYDAAVARFLSALDEIPDVTSPQFEDRIYDTEDYIPLLALKYQLAKTSDPATAARVANAAHTLTMRIANDYASGTRNFGRDTGYDIRFALRNLMLAYDWMYDVFTPAERAVIVDVATRWIDWYHTAPGYAESWPVENYYAGYLQGITLTAVATAGDNAAADRILTLLRTKLANEVPVMNDRLAGGDWAEGWNYGWYATLEFSLVNALLRDIGEDWSADFDWLQSLARSLEFMVAPDSSEMRPYGGYSGNYPHRTSPATLAVLSTTAGFGAFAGQIYREMNANPNNDFTDLPADTFYEMIFSSSPTPPPVAFSLSYLNAGSGRLFSRSSLTDRDAYFVSAENTSYSYDHYGYANGDVRLYHGDVCLVCPAAYRGDAFDGEAETPAFSTYLVNGKSQQIVLGRNNQNFLYADRVTYAVLGMRFESSYVTSRFDEDIVDPNDPLDYLIREVVHIRPGVLIVRDLHRRRHPTDTLTARFHLGSSGVKVSTFGATATFSDDHDGGGNVIGKLMTIDFPPSTQPAEMVNVFSDTIAAASYANGVLTLSDGTRVTFANGDVSVSSAPPGGHHRAVGH